MSFSDLFDSGFQKRNQGHFAAIVRVAMSDGIITDEEKAFLDRLASRLDISDSDHAEILKNYMTHPINPPTSYDKRLERLYDLFKIVFIDHTIDETEDKLISKYAIGLGFESNEADRIIEKSKEIFGGKIAYDDYEYLLNK